MLSIIKLLVSKIIMCHCCLPREETITLLNVYQVLAQLSRKVAVARLSSELELQRQREKLVLNIQQIKVVVA